MTERRVRAGTAPAARRARARTGRPSPARRPAPSSRATGPAADRRPAATATARPGSLLAGRYRLGTRVGLRRRRRRGVLAGRGHRAAARRRRSPCCAGSPPDAMPSAATADPPAPRGPARCIVRALRVGQLRAPRLRPPARRARPGRSRPARRTCSAPPSPSGCPGRSLAETVADGLIKPFAAARALQPLAAAAEAAHRHGLVLGCDHPQRIRVNPDGRAQLCFALPRPDADARRRRPRPRRASCTRCSPSRWPLSGADAARAGLAAAAARVRGGGAARRRTLRPGVPVELDALATGHPRPGSEHRATCTPRPRCTGCSTRSWPRTTGVALFPPDARRRARPSPGDVWQDGAGARARARPAHDGASCAIGLAGLASPCWLASLGYLGVAARLAVRPTPRRAGDRGRQRRGEPSGRAALRRRRPRRRPAAPRSRPPGSRSTTPAGDRDNAGRVSRVIDGNPGSGWRTFVYKQQFPALKPGVGIMVSFASPVQLSEPDDRVAEPGHADRGPLGAHRRRRARRHRR